MPVDLDEYVLSYVKKGWSLVPLKGKVPTIKNWTHLPPTTEDQGKEYLAQGNVGIRTGEISGLVVLDVDPKHGGDESLERLNHDFSNVPMVRTGSGGRHYYFKYPPTGLRNSTGALGPGLDIRGDGGQVVCPPSIHPETGNEYVWEKPEDGILPDFPERFLGILISQPITTPIDSRNGNTIPDVLHFGTELDII